MPPLRFQKILISDERYESCGVFDVDNDGVPDIVSGAYWYRGPAFDRKNNVGPVAAHGEYFDDFSTIPMDVNGDGYLDIVTGGWWGQTLRWRENPKGDPAREWKEHVIAEVGNVETTRAWDVDGDGQAELVPNTPKHGLRYFKLVGPGSFREVRVWDGPSGHGLGFGDINNDGRGEFIVSRGWIEGGKLRQEFDLGAAGIPILVADVNGDGRNDLIVGQAHGYGLDWWEHRADGSWVKHPIDPFNSQFHDLQWVDLDGDGQGELVTGKRYRAHCGHDPGEYDPVGFYYYKWTGEGFAKQIVDYGPARQGKGTGIFFQVADLDGDGRLDIVAAGKDGLVWFKNLGPAENMGDA